MKRLTYRLEDQNGNKTNTVVYDVYYDVYNVIAGGSCIPKTDKEKIILQRLAEYEDTGLTPEEIKDLISVDKRADLLIQKLSMLLEEVKNNNS